MANAGESGVPQSPEVEAPEVREQLDQSMVSHEGTAREAEPPQPGTSSHFGAVDTEVTPVRAPMSGPDDLVGDEDADHDLDDLIDPADEITPG